MRKAFAMLALLVSAIWAAPALAAAPSPGVELTAWVKSNTDLAVSQIAIAGPENVYSLEPLGPRLPTGEVLALVRTEAVNSDWREAHQFQSWDAHMLFDCQGGRVRVLRSASYAEPDRGGPAKADERGDTWFTPDREAPAARLLAAACDAGFSWPLRESSAPSSNPSAPAPGPSTIKASTTRQGAPAAVRIAQAQSDAPTNDLAGARALAAVVEPAHAVEWPQAAAAPATRPKSAPAEARLQKAVAANLAPFAAITSIAAAEPAIQPLQKVSFTAEPIVPEPSFTPQASSDQPRAKVFNNARRLAGAARSWIWRRVEVALERHRDVQAPGGQATTAAIATNSTRS